MIPIRGEETTAARGGLCRRGATYASIEAFDNFLGVAIRVCRLGSEVLEATDREL